MYCGGLTSDHPVFPLCRCVHRCSRNGLKSRDHTYFIPYDIGAGLTGYWPRMGSILVACLKLPSATCWSISLQLIQTMKLIQDVGVTSLCSTREEDIETWGALLPDFRSWNSFKMDIHGACLHPFAGLLSPRSLLASHRTHRHEKEHGGISCLWLCLFLFLSSLRPVQYEYWKKNPLDWMCQCGQTSPGTLGSVAGLLPAASELLLPVSLGALARSAALLAVAGAWCLGCLWVAVLYFGFVICPL